MDSNKDEAERCVEIAEKYLRVKKFDEAERFLKKAQKLFPTKRVEDLLITVSVLSKQNQKPESEVRKRPNVATEGTQTQANGYFTKDQIEHVERIRKCKDYYEILAVTKEATGCDIKKAYKKLALLLHPDKNKAPGAAEAFKAIGNAVAVLTDVEKRKQYDLCGSNKARVESTYSQQNHYYYTRGFETDITAEQLFNKNFKNVFPQQECYMGRSDGRWNTQSEYQNQHAHTQWTHPRAEQWTHPRAEQWTHPRAEQWTHPRAEQWTHPRAEQWTHPRAEQWTQPTAEQWAQPGAEQWTQPTAEQWAQPGAEQWTQPTAEQWAQPGAEQWTQPRAEQWKQPRAAQWKQPRAAQWKQSRAEQWTQLKELHSGHS